MLTQQEFGKKLKAFRKEHGLTQKDLAQKIHVGQASVSHWENGTLDPGFSSILKLCKAFNVTLDEFLGLEKKTTGLRCNTRPRSPSRSKTRSLNGCLTI